MKRNALALAVLASLAAPAVLAQSANPVTLYGRIYGVFESVEAKGGVSPVVRRSRVSDNSSLLGVRGTEDLGGGLKAFFQLETPFAVESNASTFASRNSAVGLQSNAWGSILFGRWDTPWKVTQNAVDPFGDVSIGGYTAAMGGGGVNNVQQSYDRRDQNVVQYWSPTWAGFAARLSYSANEARTATLNPSREGAAVTYTGGPLYVALAYDNSKDTAFGTVTPTKQDGMSLAGSYVFGPVKVAGIVQEIKRTNFTKQKAYMATATYTAGKHQLHYVYQKAKDGGANGAAIQPGCNVNMGGYQYNFSQRTFFIFQYVKVDNNAAGTCNFGANQLTIAAGQDPQGFATGIRHLF